MITYMFQHECGFRGGRDPGGIKKYRGARAKCSSDHQVRDLQILVKEYVELVEKLGFERRGPENHFTGWGEDNTMARRAVYSVFALSPGGAFSRAGAGDGGSLRRRRTLRERGRGWGGGLPGFGQGVRRTYFSPLNMRLGNWPDGIRSPSGASWSHGSESSRLATVNVPSTWRERTFSLWRSNWSPVSIVPRNLGVSAWSSLRAASAISKLRKYASQSTDWEGAGEAVALPNSGDVMVGLGMWSKRPPESFFNCNHVVPV
jgi:hypothetical protein